MAPPSKKRRIISDDEFEDDDAAVVTSSDESADEYQPRSTRQPAAGRSISVNKSPTKPKMKPRSAARTAASKAALKASRSPMKSPAKAATKSSQGGIASFLASASNGNKKKKISKITFSQKLAEEEDDGIESESDEWHIDKALMKSKKQNYTTSKTQITQTAPATSKLSKVPKRQSTPDDPRTWAEKHAPNLPADLAVHPRKVADVRNWLDQVLSGYSRKRLCVLDGPSGTGKTATISALSKELDLEILEWKNPTSTTYSQTNHAGMRFDSLDTQFREFLGRGAGYEQLDFRCSSPDVKDRLPEPSLKDVTAIADSSRRKILLLEDLPNIFSSSSSASSALTSFREVILAFLSSPQPASIPPIPVILIISESLSSISHSSSITPHRLLGPQLLNHPKVTSISFNKIAPTIIQKSLEKIVDVEARRMGMRTLPSKGLLAGLGQGGDIRSAVNALEFMMVGGDSGGFADTVSVGKKKKKTTEKKERGMKGWGEPNESERMQLELVTQREATFGIFHALGKVIYNKRLTDPPTPSQSSSQHPQAADILLEPPDHLSHFSRPPSIVDINSLIDSTGTDVQTFISGIHENYLSSCQGSSFLESMDYCIDALSDADLLSSGGKWSSDTGHSGNSFHTSHGLRQEEIAFQTAVRGVLLGLPCPVRRPAGRTQIYYPMALRLWRDKEVIDGIITLFASNNGLSSRDIVPGATAKLDALLTTMPYLRRILTARHAAFSLRNIEKVVLFRGVGGQSEKVEEVEDEDNDAAVGEEDVLGNVKTERKLKRVKELVSGQYGGRFHKRKEGGVGIVGAGGALINDTLDEKVTGLYLSDDDIEDD